MTTVAMETAVGAGAALAWAARHGVIAALRERPCAPPELAAQLGCDARALGLVVDVVVAAGWASRDAGGRITVDGPTAERISRELMLWTHLDRFAVAGETLMPPEARDAIYPAVVPYLAARFAGDAAALAAALGPARGPILDVGAGSGVWSLAMAARDGRTVVTALDGPRTLEVFRRHAEAAGLAARCETIAGDYLAVELPRDHFDRVVLANVVHLEPEARAAALVARCAPAVADGGALVLVDAVAGASPAEALGVAVYALHLALRVPESRVYTRAELEAMAGAAGLHVDRWIPLTQGLHALVARRP